MKQYLDLLKSIREHGEFSGSRQGGRTLSHPTPPSFIHDMRNGFPLITTKQMFMKGVVKELEWFLNGRSDIRYLWQNGVHIWDGDWVRWESRMKTGAGNALPKELLTKLIANLPDHKQFPPSGHGGTPSSDWCRAVEQAWSEISDYSIEFDLGNIYGVQWRGVGNTDHFREAIKMLVDKPESRQNVVSAWNADDVPNMALPPCHTLFQLRRKGPNYEWLDLTMYQRSCDSFLGLPFNIASYALLMEFICRQVPCKPRFLKIDFGDLHIYEEHFQAVDEIIQREPYELPKLTDDAMTYDITLGGVLQWKFGFDGYRYHPKLTAPLIT